MKETAQVLSWVGGFARIIVGYVFLFRGNVKTDPAWGPGVTVVTPFHLGIWILWDIYVAMLFLILLWRDRAVKHGDKVISGVSTLLFASTIGGIFTLCIPKTDLW